jgi:hypothetical protein
MLSSKSREHRLRVLENQARIATERGVPGQDRPDSQMKIPLLVEVKGSAGGRQRRPRSTRKHQADQPDLGEL